MIQTMRWFAPSGTASPNHDGTETAEAVSVPQVVLLPGCAA